MSQVGEHGGRQRPIGGASSTREGNKPNIVQCFPHEATIIHVHGLNKEYNAIVTFSLTYNAHYIKRSIGLSVSALTQSSRHGQHCLAAFVIRKALFTPCMPSDALLRMALRHTHEFRKSTAWTTKMQDKLRRLIRQVRTPLAHQLIGGGTQESRRHHELPHAATPRWTIQSDRRRQDARGFHTWCASDSAAGRRQAECAEPGRALRDRLRPRPHRVIVIERNISAQARAEVQENGVERGRAHHGMMVRYALRSMSWDAIFNEERCAAARERP